MARIGGSLSEAESKDFTLISEALKMKFVLAGKASGTASAEMFKLTHQEHTMEDMPLTRYWCVARFPV